MESLTIFDAAIYVAAFIAAFMAGSTGADLITGAVRRWQQPSNLRRD